MIFILYWYAITSISSRNSQAGKGLYICLAVGCWSYLSIDSFIFIGLCTFVLFQLPLVPWAGVPIMAKHWQNLIAVVLAQIFSLPRSPPTIMMGVPQTVNNPDFQVTDLPLLIYSELISGHYLVSTQSHSSPASIISQTYHIITPNAFHLYFLLFL